MTFIDNNNVMTGTLINDVPVISSDMVETDDVIIICSKSFIDIESQIKKELPNPSLSYHILPLLDDRFKEWGTALLDSLNKLDIYREDYKKMFIKCADDIYKKNYFFEPGMEVYSRAKRNLKNVHDVLFTQAGVGEKAGVLQFSGEDDFGHIDDNGMETINIVMLDEVVEDQPTFIKMDIEGAELSALKGASKLIKKHRPKLAICVYHKPEDLFEILELIDSFGINYKYYFRHYTNRVSGTILYCIPQSE